MTPPGKEVIGFEQYRFINRCANRTQKQILGKIANVLLEPADRIFCSDTFTIPITQEDFGNLIDASRESVNRVLNEFENDGIIFYSGKKIEINNKKTLQMISAKDDFSHMLLILF